MKVLKQTTKTIELPGHTLGSIGVDVEEKHLLVGDTLDNWITPGTGHLYSDREALYKMRIRFEALVIELFIMAMENLRKTENERIANFLNVSRRNIKKSFGKESKMMRCNVRTMNGWSRCLIQWIQCDKFMIRVLPIGGRVFFSKNFEPFEFS